MDPADATKLQKKLRAQILRADQLAWWSDEQKADKALPMSLRLEAEQRGVLAIATRKELEGVLSEIESALMDHQH